ncbi:MerR family transcriptional regulator [Chitinibacter fontanus]|uniref:MerR family transcriptional regulator n=1 Tax=Chitinibacter fontanus TaxID=1737446 RepID=A0A7D5ZGP2_9NEIS|nr:MerR family transcriptional regulator [Chitinibacter fontanus]QLI82764.1 MerR family transcriptional regulator [Chitinibacter fontanus]
MTTLYTIAQMAQITGLSVHTLRYYEQIGLLDPVKRARNGHRRYGEPELRWIEFVLRLRATGMPIEHMLEYARWRRMGNDLQSVSARKTMLEQHTRVLEQELAQLQDNLTLLQRKIALYGQMEQQLALDCTITPHLENPNVSQPIPTR